MEYLGDTPIPRNLNFRSLFKLSLSYVDMESEFSTSEVTFIAIGVSFILTVLMAFSVVIFKWMLWRLTRKTRKLNR